MASLISFISYKPPSFKIENGRLYMLQGMRKYGVRSVREFEKIVKPWNTTNKPQFTFELSGTGAGSEYVMVTVRTEDPVFHYVDKGVPAHVIKSKKPFVTGKMRADARKSGTQWKFKHGIDASFKAGSSPGSLTVVSSQSKFREFYLSLNQDINWPGIEARDFSTSIQTKLEEEKSLADQINEELKKAEDSQTLKFFS
jgi:hypothetical protein